jgi:zinc protease
MLLPSNPIRIKRVSVAGGLLLAALLTAFPPPTVAQERVLPPAGPAKPREPIYDPGQPVLRKVLKNGVVLVVQEARTTDKVAAAAALRMGTRYEDELSAGLSQIVMRSLTKGTEKLSPIELQLRLLAHKVNIESGVDADFGQVAVETVRENAAPALDLFAEILTTPSFPDTSVEAARGAFLTKAADDVESPIASTYTMFLEAMYPGSPFGRPPHGRVQSISECRRSDVVALYKKYFVGGNLAVAVVGNIDGKKVMAQLERLFATVPPGPAAAPQGTDPTPLAADTLITQSRPILARSMVYGYPAPGYTDPDYAAFMILDSYLRSGDRSPLTYWMPQRNEAAGVGIVFPPYPKRSSIAVYLAASPTKYNAARDTVAAVLGRLRDVPLDEGDWGVHVRRAQTAFFFNQNEPLVRVRNYSRWEVQGVTLDYPKQFESALIKLKPEDVRDAARRWLTHTVEVSLTPAPRTSEP